VLSYVFGVRAASLRMYASLGDLVSGWGKNLHVALGASRAALLSAPIAAVGLLALYGTPYAIVPLAAALGDRRALGAALLATAAALAVRAVLSRGYGVPLRSAWAQPLGALVIAFILLRSAGARLTGRGITWKGRRYPK
jgi:chlorobactene glucosyltransferase